MDNPTYHAWELRGEIIRLAKRGKLDYPTYHAWELRGEIIRLAKRAFNDSHGSPNNGEIDPGSTSPTRTLSFLIEEDLRKSLLAEGLELPQRYEITYLLDDLLIEHRKCLVDTHYTIHVGLPEMTELTLPGVHPNAHQITYRFTTWTCKLNPKAVSLHSLLNSWVEDFNRALEAARSNLIPP